MDYQQYIKDTIDWAVRFAPKIVLAIVIFYVGIRVIRRVNELFEKTLTGRNIDPTIRPFFVSLVDIGLKLVLFLVVANIFGFQTTSFVAVLSALAFAVGLALQGSLGHFASGILLLILKPYRVGDEIEVASTVGIVEEIQVFHTIMRTKDNRKVVMPNGLVTSGKIINISGQGDRRVDLNFSVAEVNDIDNIRRILLQVVADCPMVMKEKPTEVYVAALNGNEIKFLLRVWTESAKHDKVVFYFNEAVKKAFNAAELKDNVQRMHVNLEK